MRLQSERFLAGLVKSDADPQYPAYTGTEPCSTIGVQFYCDDVNHEYDEILFKACNGCPLLKDCFNWALHNERFYYWGASTAADRLKIRKQLGIKIDERWSHSA